MSATPADVARITRPLPIPRSTLRYRSETGRAAGAFDWTALVRLAQLDTTHRHEEEGREDER